MASTSHYCPHCGIGKLKCANTHTNKHFGKHTLTYSRVSSWDCGECGAYYKLFTPIGELIKVAKRKFTRLKECSNG